MRKLQFVPGTLESGPYDLIVAAVAHRSYVATKASDFIAALKPKGIFYDLKSLWKPEEFTENGMGYLSL